jgi:hypothetical protein
MTLLNDLNNPRYFYTIPTPRVLLLQKLLKILISTKS